MPKKCIVILLDGIGDRSYARYGNRTPLQAAETPNLDRLSTLGCNGLYHAGKLGQPLPSELAHFTMFGYEQDAFPGRGALEALGADIPLEPDDVAVLAHFVHLKNEEGRLKLGYDRMCGDNNEIETYCKTVAEYEVDDVTIRFHPTKRMFGVVTLHGEVAPCFTDSNPMVDGRWLSDVVPLDSHRGDARCVRAAGALKKYLAWAYRQLEATEVNKIRERQGLPSINGIVTQRAGQLGSVQSFRERHGLTGLSIASGVMYRGLAHYLGMDFERAVDSGDHAFDISSRIRRAIDKFDDYDFIHVHTKAPDQAAHTKSPDAKRKVIEAIDTGLGMVIDELLADPELLVVVTADHSTPSCGDMIHSGEPVPMTFVGQGVRKDKVHYYDEIAVATGCLGYPRGDEFMHLVLNYLDRGRLKGIRDSASSQLFWPGDYRPFILPGEE
ncbi:alkaline phosphatase family protein [Desulfovibrio oxyclinae]|uniref:alkaline phosphatase family protein n=1 Tax=Desulfovibrio oxyclinae TaxID=63560 RepID=UPI00036B5764|nr:alkaline phosphatase family protein [Desulfovibrio oxyclinae]